MSGAERSGTGLPAGTRAGVTHPDINRPEKQSYYLEYAARALDLKIPVILVGGEPGCRAAGKPFCRIVRSGFYFALCRPLICEPGPAEPLAGRARQNIPLTAFRAMPASMICICIPVTTRAGLVRCVYKVDRKLYQEAREWLKTWVKRAKLRGRWIKIHLQ